MTRAGSGTSNGPGFPGAVALPTLVLAADDRPMSLTASPSVASPSPGAITDVVGMPSERAEAPEDPVAVVVEPLRGRALIGRLEQLAQAELAQLADRNGMADSALPALPAPVDPALAGLAWDLGLSGEAAAKAAREP